MGQLLKGLKIYKNIFLPLVKELAKNKGYYKIETLKKLDLNSVKYFFRKIEAHIFCPQKNTYIFALNFIKENEEKQLKFEFT